MTATDAAPSQPKRPIAPTPDECDHPHPVRGVMAHEFAPYRGAIGPEGVRRTTMHYGPVVGGLPIAAWHCEACGLLRLEYPDGRKEERRLFPGPQPGLLAEVVADVVAPEAHLGMQARVSGLSVSPEIVTILAEEIVQPEPRTLPRLAVPTAGEVVEGVVVLGIAATIVGLLALGVGAVYDWTTAGWEGPIAIATGSTFGGAVLLRITASAFRHFFPFPQLAAGPVAMYREAPRMDAAAKAVVACLSVLATGLLLAGILAVYSWKPPDMEKPLVFALIAIFVLAVVVAVAGSALRAVRGETDST